MTVTLNSKGPKAPKVAADPAAERSATKFHVMLGNDCKRYNLVGVGGKDTLYEAGVRYPVTAEQRARLFSIVDDSGVRYFYDAETVERQIKATVAKQKKQRAIEEGEDIGVTRLKDIAGEDVGVKGAETVSV